MKHNSNHGNLNYDLARICEIFVILAESAMFVRPCERSLRIRQRGMITNPLLSAGRIAIFRIRSEFCFDHPIRRPVYPPVSRNDLRAGETVTDSWKDDFCAITLSDTSDVRNYGYEQSENVTIGKGNCAAPDEK